jgi:hypothetical protein
VHSAKTSAIHEVGDYLERRFTVGGTFTINNPEPGILRVSISGDWTNAGTISGDVKVSSTKDPLPRVTADGRIADSQLIVLPITVPSKVGVAEFRLSFDDDWSHYPTNDVDLILIDPMGNLITDASTLSDPELAIVKNPMSGVWFLAIDGFDLPSGTDHFKLTVTLDGKVVK